MPLVRVRGDLCKLLSCSRPRAILLPPLQSSHSCCFVRLISINWPIFVRFSCVFSLRPLVQEVLPRSFEMIRRHYERFLCFSFFFINCGWVLTVLWVEKCVKTAGNSPFCPDFLRKMDGLPVNVSKYQEHSQNNIY